MKRLMMMLGLLVCFASLLTGCSSAKNDDKIVGSWKMVKLSGKEPNKNAPIMTMEYTKDGKHTFKWVGEPQVGTYKIEGDKLIVTMNNGQLKTSTIKLLTSDTLVVLEEAAGIKAELEMKKQ